MCIPRAIRGLCLGAKGLHNSWVYVHKSRHQGELCFSDSQSCACSQKCSWTCGLYEGPVIARKTEMQGQMSRQR